ncbi:hypothetical protein GYMLUDRAFT_72736 [Collybiopsis luxurians FD-317 M1]|uniref:G-protein coupled receptors family 2 profile 2 domain-containing protein n=1 Tax=Collybiopsis luxurians FD-317 M1 TaxID=944289 RepID=A0A0D0C350_9AGAR|nr:hypothetical protein GYMLUDRAFT_72736 [Collybiopsis luxurians FD-317 M1]
MENQTISSVHSAVHTTVGAFIPIPPNEMAGAIVVNAFAILSTLALFCIFLRVSWLGVLRLLGESVAQSFFNTQLGYYAACLLIANMINGIAGLMGLPFLIHHGITDNAICTSQATVMQLGNVSTAYFTVAIAIHTFNSLVLRKRQSIYVYGPTILVGWTVSLVIALLPLISKMGPVYGPSGLACGVRASLPQHLFFFHLLPIFVAAVLSAILYTLIFLVLRGMIVIKGGLRITLNPEERWKDQSNSAYQRFVASIARTYILFLVPYSVTRLLSLGGYIIPFQAVVFAFVCWFALGVIDALLLFNTFRILGPAFQTRSTSSGSGSDLESFGTTETFKRLTSGSRTPLKVNITDAMIKEYRDLSTPNTSVSSFQSSTTVSYPERAASAQGSFHRAASLDMQRQISPVSILNRSIVVETPGSMVSIRPPVRVQETDHTRQQSESSVTSLPVPPRRTPTPSRLLIDPPARTTSSFNSPLLRPSPAQPSLSPRNIPLPSPARYDERTRMSGSSTVSSLSGELDITGWLARQYPDGSMPTGTRNQPMLSAVKPSFPASVSSADPLPSPKARLRPLLLASVERTGSMALAERYSKMYPDSPNSSF